MNYKKQDIFDFYLYRRNSDPSSFMNMLYSLIAKADVHNRLRIRAGFPVEVHIFTLWEQSESEEVFFRDWDLKI